MNTGELKKLNIPDCPGVYFFLNGKKICYIGKATSLRDRIRSYFGKDLIATRGPLLVDMVFQADKIDWQPTESVLEALILEAELIKKHQPRYNIREKDDKSWNYVCITKPARNASSIAGAGGEKLSKVVVVREKELREQNNFSRFTLPRVRGGTYATKNSFVPFANMFGPFTNGGQLREALKIIRRIFPYLDDKSKNGYKFYKQVGLVPDISSEEGIEKYKKDIKNLKLLFQAKKKKILKNLEKEMKEYAKKREFERAGEAKRQVFALRHINDIALLKNDIGQKHTFPNGDVAKQDIPEGKYVSTPFRIESYDIAHMSGRNMVGVMTVVEDGMAAKNEYRKFKIRTTEHANDTGALVEVINRRLTHPEWRYPNLIVVDGGKAQLNAINNALWKAGMRIPVVSVVKDERHRAREILGDKEFAHKYENSILLSNSEAHRFAIAYHKNMRGKNFLK